MYLALPSLDHQIPGSQGYQKVGWVTLNPDKMEVLLLNPFLEMVGRSSVLHRAACYSLSVLCLDYKLFLDTAIATSAKSAFYQLLLVNQLWDPF